MNRLRATAAIASVILLLGAAVVGRASALSSANMCGLSAPAPLRAQFAMSRARDFWLHFPHAGLAPELEIDRPATVVVFDGPIEIASMRAVGSTAPKTYSNVVCVVVDGERTLYANVDFTDFHD
jgi:hypothetical protein